MRRWMMVIACFCLLCIQVGDAESLYVRKVAGLPEDFFLGMDVSSAYALEASGVRHKDEHGQETDLFALLAQNGVNLIRLRVWNDPFTEDGHGYGGGNNDIQTAALLGQRATQAGMRVLIDFHYSDFWADPSKQMVPKAWAGLKVKEKANVLETWTWECLSQLRGAGVDVAMVQLGNETNGKLCGEKTWMNLYRLMSAGAKAVRQVYPDALIAVHFANPENAENYWTYASKLDYYALDYDVFGTSYYPYWHGTLENLQSVLSTIQEQYGKKTMVLETSYAWTLEDGDGSGNTIGEGGVYARPYPITVQGQTNAVVDVIEAMQAIGGIGVCYWEGAWVPVPGESIADRQLLWETYGSGWASSFASEYDPEDAGVYYGGCACENQALFDFSAKALPSLSLFRLVRTGQEADKCVDALDDIECICDITGTITLPQTVLAVMNDGSREEIPVRWEDVDLAGLQASGPSATLILGEAGGMQARLYLSLVEYNYVSNGSFEDADLSMWHCTDFADCAELYCETKKTDSKTGERHWHFYTPDANHVHFTLEQTLQDLPAGKYDYALSVMGGDAGEQEVYSYVKINEEEVARVETAITSWNQWHTPEITEIVVREGDMVTVGISVQCNGAGAWGKIDDVTLHRME